MSRAAPHALYLAEFDGPDELRAALTALRDRGYTRLDAYTPYPVPGVAEAVRAGRSRLPYVVFGAGLLGGAASYAIQWYADAWSYALDIGGRPAHAVPAFIVATFEGTVLCAALAAFVGLFASLGLPRLWHPEQSVEGFERASVDRFWLAVDGRDRRAADTAATVRELESLHPLRVARVEADS